MTINVVKVLKAVGVVTDLVEKLRGPGNGPQKFQDYMEAVPEVMEAVEEGIDRDILNDAAVMQAHEQMIAAIFAFKKAVEAAKKLKGTGKALPQE